MSFSYSLDSNDINSEDDTYFDSDGETYINNDAYGYDDDKDLDSEEFGSFNIKNSLNTNESFEFFKNDEDDGKPKILLMGLRSTFDPDMIFGGCGALIYVIDAQDNTTEAVSKLFQTIQQSYSVNKKIKFEVFIHKVDNISDEMKIDIRHEVQRRITEDLETHSDLKEIQIRYHQTSIYDHSIFDAFSKVIQRLLPILPTLEKLLDVLVSNSKIEKAFMFDVVSKIYIASDTQPCDAAIYELCSDVIDIVLDVCDIYGKDKGNKKEKKKVEKKFSKRDKRKLEEKSFNYDEKTLSIIHLDNSSILYLRQVNKYLALICLLQKEAFSKMGLIDFNFKCFKEAIKKSMFLV